MASAPTVRPRPVSTVVLHPTIRDLDATEWNLLAGRWAFATHGWLLTTETCCRAVTEPLYVALRSAGRLVG